MPKTPSRRPTTVLTCALLLALWCLSCNRSPPVTGEAPPPVLPDPPVGPEPQDSTPPELQERPIEETAAALGRELGFVSLGTFVVEREPNQVRNGRRTRTVKAYLPVGTPVFLSNCDTFIREGASLETSVTSLASSSRVHRYCDVVTSLGIHGLVRQEQVTRFEGRRVAVAIADTLIEILNPSSDQPVGSFSRTSGVYVEVIGDSTQYYDVRMPWSEPANIPGRLLKGSREGHSYVLIDATAKFAEPVEFGSLTDEELPSVSRMLFSGLLDPLIKGLTSELNHLTDLQCITTVSIDLQAGIEAFGTGLGIQTATNLFEAGFKYEIRKVGMFANNRLLRTLIAMKKNRCETVPSPRLAKMIAFGLFRHGPPEDGNSFIFLDPNRETNGLLPLMDEGVSPVSRLCSRPSIPSGTVYASWVSRSFVLRCSVRLHARGSELLEWCGQCRKHTL